MSYECNASELSENTDKESQKKQTFAELLESFQVNDCLVKLIYQFLLYNEFDITAENLVREAPRLGFDVFGEQSHTKDKDTISKEACKQILTEYRNNNWRQFFDSWSNLVPENIRETMEYKILTCKLHVHFAVLPIRIVYLKQHLERNRTVDSQTMKILEKEADIYIQKNGDLNNNVEKKMIESMEQLKKYCTTEGPELQNETQLVPFFALPYLTDLHMNPAYFEIFDMSWLDKLTVDLQMFLMRHRRVQQTTVSQKTSTNSLIPSSNKSHSISLPEDNLKNRNNSTFDQNRSNDLPPLQTDPAAVSLEITRRTVLDYVPQSNIDHNISTIPNDRNIPMFTEDAEFEKQLAFYNAGFNDIQTKSAQTRISGVKTTANLLLTSDLKQPASIVNSAALDKNPKASIRSNEELMLAKSYLYNMHGNYQKLKLRFHKLHTDYHKLIGIAGELTAALENSVRGEVVDLQGMLESCMKIFPDLFNQNIRDNTEITTPLKSEEQAEGNGSTEMKHTMLNIGPLSPKLLDFKKIKLHLISANVKTKLILLQALRWKITLSQPSERDETVHEYIAGDLLGLHGQIATDNGKAILPYLLMPTDIVTPHPLQQSVARLLNALASLRCGRDYLAVGPTVLNTVIQFLNDSDKSVDAFTCDMVIAMLQKLSLRKQQRIYMIETGLVEWLVYHLKTEGNKIGSYRLEYATALLMNLSLHKKAQIRAAVIAPAVISTLTTLLSTYHMPALPYVNGALNSFLSNEKINEEARKTELGAVLEYHRNQNTGELRKHLDHILKIHRRNCTEDMEDEETVDDDNEELDILEDELEEDDPVKVRAGELYGEALLSSCYSILPNILRSEDPSTVESPLKSPKLHSRSAVEQSPRQKRHSIHIDSHDVYQMPTHDKGLSPRFTPAHFKTRKRNVIRLQPIHSLPSNPTRVHDSTPSSPRLSPINSREYVSTKQELKKTLDEDDRSAATGLMSEASAKAETDRPIDPKDSLPTYALSPYAFTFTRTYESKMHSDKSIEPTLKSNISGVTNKGTMVSIKSQKSGMSRRKSDEPSRARRGRSKSSDLSEGRRRKVKLIRLKYFGETNDDETAICLFANQSSKESSRTTIVSSLATLTSARESIAEVNDKLSSIASLQHANGSDKPMTAPQIESAIDSSLKKEEDAFLAKPKIMRTPPQSAQSNIRKPTTASRSKMSSRAVSTK